MSAKPNIKLTSFLNGITQKLGLIVGMVYLGFTEHSLSFSPRNQTHRVFKKCARTVSVTLNMYEVCDSCTDYE